MQLRGPLVDAGWLAQALASPEPPALFDVRWYLDGRSGRAAYEAGHIPGAVFVDLETDLAGPPGTGGRHPLPDPAAFAAAMGRSGVGRDTTVVAYDDAGGTVAARLWWMLRATGHEAAVLDGGLAAWTGPLDAGTVEPGPVEFEVRPWPVEAVASIDEVAGGGAVLVDARAPERFRGEVEPIDPRAGHIPGAANLPAASLLGGDGRFLRGDELRARLAAASIVDGAHVIAYCGSGVTACHVLLAMEVVGRSPGRLYPGSWSQWSAHGRPVEVGA